MSDLERLIVENSDMNLEQAREYLRTIELDAWAQLARERE